MGGYKIEVTPGESADGFRVEMVKARSIDPKLAKVLGDLIRDEMHAMTTYMQQASVASGWGYVALAQHFWEESNEEMVHAMKLMDRLNVFGELPKIPQVPKIKVVGDVKGMLQHQMELEETALTSYNDAIKSARDANDHGTKQILSAILGDEEKHYDWLQNQMELVRRLGTQDYLATMTKLPELEIREEGWRSAEADSPGDE